jgi:hypothetical protein
MSRARDLSNNAQGSAPQIIGAKGDLLAGTADNVVTNLAVGTNGQVLTAASGQTTGLQWATPAAAGSWTLITETLPSAVTSVTFSSIPSTYKHLMLEWIGIYHSSATGDAYNIRINNSSTAGDYNVGYRNSGGSVSYDNGGTDIVCTNGQGSTLSTFGQGASTQQFGQASQGKFIIYNYADTTKYKKYESESYFTYTSVAFYGNSCHGTFRSTSAVTSINIVRTSGTTNTLNTMTNGYIRLWGSV